MQNNAVEACQVHVFLPIKTECSLMNEINKYISLVATKQTNQKKILQNQYFVSKEESQTINICKQSFPRLLSDHQGD